jgi:hypothetical protein
MQHEEGKRQRRKKKWTNVCELPNDLPCASFVNGIGGELQGKVGQGAELGLDEELVVLLPCVGEVKDVRVRFGRGKRAQDVDFFEMS